MVGKLGRLPLISADEWPLGDGGQRAPQALAHHWSSSVNSDLPTSHFRALLKETWLQWHLLWALTGTPEGTTCTEGNLWETLLHQHRPLSGCLSGFSWGLHELKFMLTWDSFYLRWRTGPRGSGGEECLPNLISCPQFLSLPLYFLVQEGSVVVSLFLGLPPCPHSEGLGCSFH